MSEQEQKNPIRTLELRLLRCSVSSHHKKPDTVTPTTHICNLIEQVIELIHLGDYIGVLSSDAAKHVFNFDHCLCLGDGAEVFYAEVVVKRVEMFLSDDDIHERGCRVFLVMAIAVAAFLAFTQANKTGPLNNLPLMPLTPLLPKEEGVAGGWTDWEVWARNQLMLAGSDLLGKLSNLQYIVFAKILLMKLRDLLFEGSVYCIDGMRSISWWLARLLLFQQKMMDEQSSSLFNLLQVFTRECLHDFGTSENVTAYWGANLQEEEALTIVSTLHLEVGIMEITYGRVDSSRLHFEAAEVASGLHLSVSGAMGFRTVHQVEPKTQLVLDTGTSTTNICTINKDDMLQDYCEASDVLMTPTLLGDNGNSVSSANGIQNGGITCLKEVQQAVILGQCLLIEKSTRQDEMQRWDMAPYIEAIDSQQFSYFTIRSFCDILRIRWESTRSRTKERALLMMDKLVQRVFDPSPGVAQRIYCCYVVDFPCIPALQKEHADILVRCGLIGEAVKIYEDLELWDNVIYCYCLMEKKAAAVELINTRLFERPNDPRLWCSLGDITNDDACYEKALEVSENRSARAKRSLARNAYNRGDYESSKILWEAAMALNSLYPDGWFALGAAALKARDVDKALDGFTRSVQLDPENGEAWNNIACLHMVKKKNKESFIAFKEALKFKRNSWQLWENFSHVAADIGNFSQALEAVQKVLNMTKNKRIDTELLERMMLEIEGRTLSCPLEFPVETNSNDHNNNIIADSDARYVGEPTCSEVDLGRTRETEHLVELIGKILQQIVQSGGGAETWGLFARWHKLKGDLTMCSEALIKQVRSYQGSNLWKDVVQFKKFARASLELCNVYLELASRNSSRRELLAAEMHLKSTIRQASSFSETEEYRDLQACLDKVQT